MEKRSVWAPKGAGSTQGRTFNFLCDLGPVSHLSGVGMIANVSFPFAWVLGFGDGRSLLWLKNLPSPPPWKDGTSEQPA